MSAPTIVSAVLDTTRGNYYEFSKNSVVHRFVINGEVFVNYWIHDMIMECEVCQNTNFDLSGSYMFCSGYCAKEYDDKIMSCCLCGSDCNGSDYERWQFCSRTCMVRY